MATSIHMKLMKPTQFMLAKANESNKLKRIHMNLMKPTQFMLEKANESNKLQ